MKLKKCLAVGGLLSPFVWAATAGWGEAHITVVLSVLLIVNPATLFLGNLVFSSLLINYGFGNVRRGFGFEYVL